MPTDPVSLTVVDDQGASEAGPGVVADEVLVALRGVLGIKLHGVVAHGSWVHGDFAAGRSDVDLIAVLTGDPTEDVVVRLAPLLDHVVEKHPRWNDRLELALVSRSAVEDVLRDSHARHMIARVSPGEPLHLVEANLHHVLDWDAATRGRLVYGGDDLLPAVPPPVLRRALQHHLGSWPTWVEGLTGEALAYAVLTVCRSAAYATTGVPHSKRQGGRWVAARHPAWSRLIADADAVWHEPGASLELDNVNAVRFVREFALAAARVIGADDR